MNVIMCCGCLVFEKCKPYTKLILKLKEYGVNVKFMLKGWIGYILYVGMIWYGFNTSSSCQFLKYSLSYCIFHLIQTTLIGPFLIGVAVYVNQTLNT